MRDDPWSKDLKMEAQKVKKAEAEYKKKEKEELLKLAKSK